MSALAIVARITARPDRVDLVRSELHKLVEPTRAEEGCLQYDLHEDDERPGHFLFFEHWTTRELWQTHMQSPLLQAYQAAPDGAVESFELYEMTKIA